MILVKLLLKMAGKDEFQLDKRIDTKYILHLCWKYGLMMLRGKIVSLGYAGISNGISVGSKVKLYNKKNIIIESKSKIHDCVKIDALGTEGVVIGKGVVIGHDTVIECTGSLQHIGKGISIGDRTTFGNSCFFGAAGGINIGEDVVAGQFVRFHSENHNYSEPNTLIKYQGVTHKGIKVGNNCWIGAGAVFLDGAELADGCVVAANAVVTKKFPANSVIGGVPAKIIHERC